MKVETAAVTIHFHHNKITRMVEPVSKSRIRRYTLLLLLTLVVVASVLTELLVRKNSEISTAQQLSEPLERSETLVSNRKSAPRTKWDLMDHGPFFCSSLGGAKNPVLKGVSIRLGSTNEGALCFDTELLRVRAAWTGNFLRFSRFREGLNDEPQIAGRIAFQTLARPGWAINQQYGGRAQFKGMPYGALPKTIGHFNGIYTHGHRTILSYSVGGRSVLEMPEFVQSNGIPIFARSIQIDSGHEPLTLELCDTVNAQTLFVQGLPVLMDKFGSNQTFTVAKILGAPDGYKWEVQHGAIQLQLPPLKQPANFTVFIASGDKKNLLPTLTALPLTHAPTDLKSLCHGGPALWTNDIITQSKPGIQKGAYQVDELTLPDENPWRSWIRPSGLDFFSDGRAALCSLSGDIWVMSHGNARNELHWRRYATGLFQPLGLKIVRDQIYVTCRDALVRLHDLNHDGEADFYESFNSDIATGRHFHEFCLDLQTDSQGSFYTFKGSNLNAPTTPYHGTLLKISADGSTIDVVARGFRAPNGLCITPEDEMFATDNEGEWMPACKLNRIERNKFYGFVDTAYTDKIPTEFEPPMFWLPHAIDNSSASPIWAGDTRWGPLANHLLHTSYGTCSLFAVMNETVNGHQQGGVVRLPVKFDTGIMRGRFNPRDGQLYLCGLRGWQTSATKDGNFYRVRYTGQPANLPSALHIRSNAVEIAFTDLLDATTANDKENYSIQCWNYKWSRDYGSADYSIKTPGPYGRDTVDIVSATLLPDRKTVSLAVPNLKPAMQMKIEYNIDTADGGALHQEIYNTVNAVPTNSPATSNKGS